MMLAPIFFSAIVLISGMTCFFLGTQGMYVNRTFINMPISLFEANVVSISEIESGITAENNSPFKIELIKNNIRIISGDEEIEEAERIYCFDKKSLEEDIKDYLNLNLKCKVNSYQIAIKYYIYENDAFIEDSSLTSNALKVRFKCRYYKYYEVDQSLSYYIKEGWEENYEWKIRSIV